MVDLPWREYGILDIEFIGEPWDGALLCVGWRNKALPAPAAHDRIFTPEWEAMLAELADPQIAKVVFTKADHRWLMLAGFDIQGPIIDVQVMAWVGNETTELSLEWVAQRYARVPDMRKDCPVHGDLRVRELQSGGAQDDQAQAPQATLLQPPLYRPRNVPTPARPLASGGNEADASGSAVYEDDSGLDGGPQDRRRDQDGPLPADGRARTPRQREQAGQPAGEHLRLAGGDPQQDRGCVCELIPLTMDKRIKRRGGSLYFETDEGKLVALGEAPMDQLLAYNERDLDATEQVYLNLLGGLTAEGLLDYWASEQVPFTPVLVGMETRGVPVDVGASEVLRERLVEEIEDLETVLKFEARLPREFNLGSDQQLGAYLYQKSFEWKTALRLGADAVACVKSCLDGEHEDCEPGFPGIGEYDLCMVNCLPEGFIIERLGRDIIHGHIVIKGRGLKRGRLAPKCASEECEHPVKRECIPSVAAPALRVQFGGEPWIQKLLELKVRETIVGTFLVAFRDKAVDGRLYAQFVQTGTVTGRLSSRNPNLQNIPGPSSTNPNARELGRQVRNLFVAQPGTVFVHGDYSQLEPRLMAHFSQDPVLLDIFRNDRDIYLETAKGVFGREFEKGDRERDLMKTYILAMGYGAGARSLTMKLAEAGFPLPLAEVEATLEELKNLYRVFFEWKEAKINEAFWRGYIETLSGRRRHLAGELGGGNWKNAGKGERQAVNATIQGSAADIVQHAMIGVDHAYGRFLPLLVQVHDELLWEAREVVNPTASASMLVGVRALAEKGHGYTLSVPLKFEPRFVGSWGEGKG